jgi:hypothetical protein
MLRRAKEQGGVMREFNRWRRAAAQGGGASPSELREASERYKEIQEELRTMDLAPETRHGEERLDRYERDLRLRAMREEFQATAEAQLPPPQRTGPMMALVMTVASFLLCSFCAGGTYFGLLLVTQKPSAQSVADSFWSSMEATDYTSAHSYFSPTVQLTADQFDTQAKAADTQYGAVVSATVSPHQESASQTTTVLNYNVRRSKGTTYPVTITLDSIQGNWGISDYGAALAPPSGSGGYPPTATPTGTPSGSVPAPGDQVAERRPVGIPGV